MSKPTLIAIKGRPNWYILHRGKRISTGTPDKLEAFAELERYRKGTPAAHRSGPRTLEELLEKWSETYREKAGSGARWKKKWRFVVSTLNRHAGWLTLDRITRDWSIEYREARHGEGVQNAAIRQELGLVSAAWRKHGPGDPPDFDRPPEAEARDVWLTKEQAGALVDACQAPHLRLFVHLALATAGRSGALLRLTWSAVDLEKGLVDLRRAGLPGGKRHSHVPVSNEALEELCDAKKVAKTPFVIEYQGRRINDIRRAFSAAVARAGLSEEVTPHCLRHTCATWMAQGGVDLWEIAGFLGHGDIKLVQKTYGHHSPHYMSAARAALSFR
jgi:integrase